MRGRKLVKIVSPQASALEAIARFDTICGSEKTARERKYTIRETETTKDTSLAQVVVKKHTNEKEGRMGLLLPAFDEVRGREHLYASPRNYGQVRYAQSEWKGK
jgi:hypothetical protein